MWWVGAGWAAAGGGRGLKVRQGVEGGGIGQCHDGGRSRLWPFSWPRVWVRTGNVLNQEQLWTSWTNRTESILQTNRRASLPVRLTTRVLFSHFQEASSSKASSSHTAHSKRVHISARKEQVARAEEDQQRLLCLPPPPFFDQARHTCLWTPLGRKRR